MMTRKHTRRLAMLLLTPTALVTVLLVGGLAWGVVA